MKSYNVTHITASKTLIVNGKVAPQKMNSEFFASWVAHLRAAGHVVNVEVRFV